MVTRGIDNYELWKSETKERYDRFGDNISHKFVDFLSSRFDKLGRPTLDSKICWRLWDLHNKVTGEMRSRRVRGDQHQVYGFFGRGGYGKTTVAKQVLSFHDPTFNQSRICKTFDEFDDKVCELIEKDEKHKAILIDEPNKETHNISIKGRIIADVIGQVRQANLFIGVAATTLKNVRPDLYGLVTGIFAFRDYFVYDYYDEELRRGALGKLWKEFDPTYNVFYDYKMMRLAYLKNVHSYHITPIDYEINKYNKEKRLAILVKLKKLAYLKKYGRIPKNIERDLKIYDYKKNKGVTYKNLSKKTKIGSRQLMRIVTRIDRM